MSTAELKAMQFQLEQAAARLDPSPDLTFKAMFGGLMGYAHGRPFASLSNIGLALKLPTAQQTELLQIAGAKRLQYEPDAPISKQYVVVPPSFLESSEELHRWVERSITHVQTLPAPRPRRKA